MNETYTFQARVYIIREGEYDRIVFVRAWCNELDPMDDTCSAEELVEDHIRNCISVKDLRKTLELPDEGNFQVLISGSIRGEEDYWGEYDEELTIDKTVKFKAIPPDWLKPHVCEHGISLDNECQQCNED